MRKYVGFLFGLAILCHPITVDANSLSLIPTEEETGIPSDIYEEAQIVGGEFCICPELLLAIAERESRFTEDATNGPCLGLMQVNAKVHKQRFVDAGWSEADWSDSYKSLYVAGSYLAELFEQYEDPGIVLGVYHGEKNAVERGEAGQLSKYVTGILERSAELERLANK